MDNPGTIAGDKYILIKHADIKHRTGDIPFILRMSLHNFKILRAQETIDTWVSRLNLDMSRSSLLQKGVVTISNCCIGDNPYVKSRVQTDWVIFRDLAMHESRDQLIKKEDL